MTDLKAIVRDKMGEGAFADPDAVRTLLHGMGFRISVAWIQICKGCKQAARSHCCSAHSRQNRIKKCVVHDMLFVSAV